MALKLGDLVAVLRADDSQFAKGLKGAEGKFREHAGRLKGSALAAGAAAGLSIGAGLTGVLDLDAARAKLTAQIGDPALAKRIGEAAGRVYGRGFGATAADAMQAARSVMQAGLLPKGADAAVIEDLTVKAQTLATTFDLDVTQAARAAGTMVKTGLAKNATEAFDIITRGAQVTGDQAGDLLDTFSEYSTQFREVGVSGPKAMGLLSQAVQAGARDIDTAADAIKEFAIRSQDGSKTSIAAFKSLNLNGKAMTATFAKGGPEADKAMKLVVDRLKAMKDPVEQRATAVALFGTKAEDLGDALYALDPSTAVAGMGDLAGSTKKAGDALEKSGAQKLDSFKRKAQQALVEKLGEAVPYIEKTFGWLQKNSGWVGPLAIGLGVLAGAIYAIVLAQKVWTAVQWLLNTALFASPITWIVLAVVALVAIIIIIATKTTWFQTIWKVVWGGIKAAASAVGSWFKDTLWGKWIKGAWNSIVAAGGKAWDWMKALPGKLKSAFSKVADFITSPFRSAFNGIAKLWNRTAGSLNFTVPSWIPLVGGNSFSLPKIPMLAKGGIVPATPGGTLALIGEGGQDEAVVPLPRGGRGLAGGGGPTEVRLTGELRVRGSDLVLVLRDRIAVGGGNVQKVIGTSS